MLWCGVALAYMYSHPIANVIRHPGEGVHDVAAGRMGMLREKIRILSAKQRNSNFWRFFCFCVSDSDTNLYANCCVLLCSPCVCVCSSAHMWVCVCESGGRHMMRCGRGQTFSTHSRNCVGASSQLGHCGGYWESPSAARYANSGAPYLVCVLFCGAAAATGVFKFLKQHGT